MEKTQEKQGKFIFIRKVLIFLVFGVCCAVTNICIAPQNDMSLAFGEERTAQELLAVWLDEGEVYPVGKLAKLDINEATEDELMDLPEIGETLAKRILEYKEEIGEFTDIMELDDVTGIGEKTIAAISDYICV